MRMEFKFESDDVVLRLYREKLTEELKHMAQEIATYEEILKKNEKFSLLSEREHF